MSEPRRQIVLTKRMHALLMDLLGYEVEELRKRDVYFEQLIFPDEGHRFLLHRNWIAAYRATADFFDRMLKQRPASVSGGS